MRAFMTFDGGARPTNPGHAGFAVVIDFPGTKKKRQVISRYIGKKTNNIAEYTGLIVGIKYAKELGARELFIVSDSKLVVEQVNGRWKCKTKHIVDLCEEAQKLLERNFPGAWELRWKKRLNNTVADDYCTKAINHGMNRNPWTPAKIKEKRVGEVHDPFAPRP